MTEHGPGQYPRVDLRPLDVHPDGARVDAIVAVVMDRVRSDGSAAGPGIGDLGALIRARRYLLAAAAVLAAIAAASVLASSRASDGTTDVIARWAEARHVPSNGELLAVYRGYRP